MAASLEQIQILSREYDLAEHEYQKALDAMRRLVIQHIAIDISFPFHFHSNFFLVCVLKVFLFML